MHAYRITVYDSAHESSQVVAGWVCAAGDSAWIVEAPDLPAGLGMPSGLMVQPAVDRARSFPLANVVNWLENAEENDPDITVEREADLAALAFLQRANAGRDSGAVPTLVAKGIEETFSNPAPNTFGLAPAEIAPISARERKGRVKAAARALKAADGWYVISMDSASAVLGSSEFVFDADGRSATVFRVSIDERGGASIAVVHEPLPPLRTPRWAVAVWAVSIIAVAIWFSGIFGEREQQANTTAETGRDYNPACLTDAGCKPKTSVTDQDGHVEVDGVRWKVTGVKTASRVGDSAYPNVAKGRYVLVNMEASLAQRQPVLFTATIVKLATPSRRYNQDPGATLALQIANVETFSLENLYPGDVLRGTVVFDVPRQSLGSRLTLRIDGLDATQPERGLIRLHDLQVR
jgi:Domain of unknown function (DUF4352)